MLKGLALGVLLIIVVSTLIASVIFLMITGQADFVTYASSEIADLLTLRTSGTSKGELPEEPEPQPPQPPIQSCNEQCQDLNFASGTCVAGNGGTSPYPPEKLWSDDSYWYMKIKDNPQIHPNNDEMINWLMTYHAKNPNINWNHWTHPVYEIYEDTPYTVQKIYVESSGKYINVPFPDPYSDIIPAQEADHALTVIDWVGGVPGGPTAWTLGKFYPETYTTYSASPYPIGGSGLDPLGGAWLGGGSGCPKPAYMIRPEEIEAGVINHPLGCAFRAVPGDQIRTMLYGFVWPPASHTDRAIYSGNSNAIPEGARIQLDPAIDLDSLGLSNTGKIIAKAMQDYGIVAVEAGGSWHIYAEHDFTAEWNGPGPEMSGGLLNPIASLITPTYNPWRVINFVLYPEIDDNLSEFELPSDGGTGKACQSGETQIDDACPSGQICCCSGTAPPPGECTPGNDIIQRTEYPSGSCSSTSTLKWSHSTCGQEVCHQGNCRNVDADIISYTAPSGKIARSDTMSIPYTIKNTGDIQWCFMTETALTESDSSKHWIKEFNSVPTGSSATDSISYQISCSDPLGSWSGPLYTTTDFYSNGGWNVWGPVNYNFQVVECLNNQDCTSCRGSGYTCDLVSNTCKSPTPSPPPSPDLELHHCMWLFPYRYLPWKGHYPGGLGNEFENPQYLIDNLEGLQIDCLIVHGGEWQADGSISRDPGVTPLMWTNFINAIKAWDTNVKVLVWVTTIGGKYTDLSDPVKRGTMYNSVRTLLNEASFDGYNEDYEGWGGDLVHLRTFYEGIISTVKSMGKIATVATEVEWGGYHIEDYTYLLEGFDYNMPMFYGHILYYDTNSWNKILQYSPCPVNMGLSVWNSVFDKDTWTYKITFDQQLAWVETQSKNNLAGIAIWCYDHMSYEDMDTWEAWVNK